MNSSAYHGFSERLIDAMIESGYSARAGSWSRFPVEIEPLRREAGAKSLTTARKYLEGSAFPRRYRLELIADWLRVNTEWLASGNGPRYAGTAAYTGPDLPEEALELAKAWAALPRYYREPIRSWVIMATIQDNLTEEQKILPPIAQGLERRKKQSMNHQASISVLRPNDSLR